MKNRIKLVDLILGVYSGAYMIMLCVFWMKTVALHDGNALYRMLVFILISSFVGGVIAGFMIAIVKLLAKRNTKINCFVETIKKEIREEKRLS